MAVAPEKVINGTFGECWVNDHQLLNITSVQAKISVEKTEVNQCGTLAKGYKITGTDGKGVLKANKVDSFWINLQGDDIRNGKVTNASIITNLADPDADGNERIKLTGVTFDELTLADWEAKKLVEDNIPFTFTGFEPLDTIPNL